VDNRVVIGRSQAATTAAFFITRSFRRPRAPSSPAAYPNRTLLTAIGLLGLAEIDLEARTPR
jgi:hypothetical protein